MSSLWDCQRMGNTHTYMGTHTHTHTQICLNNPEVTNPVQWVLQRTWTAKLTGLVYPLLSFVTSLSLLLFQEIKTERQIGLQGNGTERRKSCKSVKRMGCWPAGPWFMEWNFSLLYPVRSKGDHPWVFFGRNDAKAETPVLWPPHANSWLIGKDSDARGIGGRRRGWDGWIASLTRWTWVWVNSRGWWWTGRPGVLWFMGSQRVGHDWVTELNWMISDVESFLMHILAICIFSLVNYLFKTIAHVKIGLLGLCFEFLELFICSRYKSITS